MWTIIQFIWRPVLEILILTVGIYYLLVFLRGPRALFSERLFAVLRALQRGLELVAVRHRRGFECTSSYARSLR